MKKITLFFTAFFLSIALHAQNTITTDTILQLSTCAGGNVLVPFSTTGTFPIGTVYTAQLSNAFGQFTTPVNIGSFPINVGFIYATIPATTNFGFLYKIRVVTAVVTGTPCPNTLIITQVAQLNQIIASPNDTVCLGDSVTLTALVPGGTYVWSTGATTQSITVAQAGNYSVTVTDILMCETDTSVNVVTLPQPCLLNLEETETNNFTISPNPTHGLFQVRFSNYSVNKPSLSVYNSVGQKIEISPRWLNSSTCEVDFSSTEAGVFFVEIVSGDQSTTKRIVKE